MRYRSLAASAASAALLAAIATPAAAAPYKGDCTRTKALTTCVQTTVTEDQLQRIQYDGGCGDENGNMGTYQIEHYATVTTTQTITYKGRKVISSGNVFYTYSDRYTVDLGCVI